MTRSRIATLALALVVAATSAGVGAGTLGAQVRPAGTTTVVLTGPADRMLNGVLRLSRGDAVVVRATSVSQFEIAPTAGVWRSGDTTIVTVEPGQVATTVGRGTWTYTWEATVRSHAAGDTAITFRGDFGMAVLPVHVSTTVMAARPVVGLRTAPLLRDPSTSLAVATIAPPATATVTAAPAPPGAAPAGFTAQYAGAGKVAFSWQPVAGAAGVAVYDARTGGQVSPLVPGTSWVSGALAPGSYTFVAAPWRAVAPGAVPTVTAERSAPLVVTIPPY